MKREGKVKEAEALGSKWFHLSATSYEVYSEVDARFTAEIALFMDLFHERFDKMFGGKSKIDKRPDVFIYGTQQRFKDHLKSSGRGWYRFQFDQAGRATENALYSFVGSDEERDFKKFYRPILLHEGTHLLLRERMGVKPHVAKWFDEGLATYFQLWDLSIGNTENLKARPALLINQKDVVEAFAAGTIPGLTAVFAITDSEWAADNFGPVTKGQYSAVETLFCYLMRDSASQKLVARLCDEVIAGKDPAKLLTTGDWKAIEKGWLASVEVIAAPKK